MRFGSRFWPIARAILLGLSLAILTLLNVCSPRSGGGSMGFCGAERGAGIVDWPLART